MKKGTITIKFDLYEGTCEEEMITCCNKLIDTIIDSKDCDIGKLVNISYG